MSQSPLQSLRSVRDALREVRCPDCGKRTVQLATGWRGHGTGQRGASHYNATGLEPRDPETFCTCPQNQERGEK